MRINEGSFSSWFEKLPSFIRTMNVAKKRTVDLGAVS